MARHEDTNPNGTLRPPPTDEETPLLQTHIINPLKSPTPLHHLIHAHMTANVRRSWTDLILLSCYIITGLLDSSSIFIWGAFVSMQTGNTVYFGLGIVDPAASTRWIKSGVSIASFCAGSFCFARLHRALGQKRRWVLTTSYTVQMLCVLGAAVMVTLGEAEDSRLSWHILVPLGMLAFQSAGQAVTSRVMQFNGLPSVVLTSTYCDLFSDPQLFLLSFKDNVERNRRISAVVLLLCGALLGGTFAHSGVGMAGALWTAVALKLMVVIAWLSWPAEKEDEGA